MLGRWAPSPHTCQNAPPRHLSELGSPPRTPRRGDTEKGWHREPATRSLAPRSRPTCRLPPPGLPRRPPGSAATCCRGGGASGRAGPAANGRAAGGRGRLGPFSAAPGAGLTAEGARGRQVRGGRTPGHPEESATMAGPDGQRAAGSALAGVS